MRTLLSLALLVSFSAGLHAQELHRANASPSVAAVAPREASSRDAQPMAARGSTIYEQSEAIEEADGNHSAPIFDREFVRHVAAMVIAAVLTTLILRAIF